MWKIRYNSLDRPNITVKGHYPLGKYLAPTWKKVMEYKKGKIFLKKYQMVSSSILCYITGC